MSEQNKAGELAPFVGCEIVVDTDSSYVYIGRLEAAGPDYVVLTDVDAHDTVDTKSSKEFYAQETKRLGPRANRKRTLIRLARVMSICKLEDVLTF